MFLWNLGLSVLAVDYSADAPDRGGGGVVIAEDLHDWRMTVGGFKKVAMSR